MAKFNLSELRLIAYCLAHVKSREMEERSFLASVRDLTNLFPIDRKSAYAVVRKAVIGVNSKPLEIETDKEIEFWNWFSGFIYKKNSGEFEFKITPEIMPYLFKLKGSFSRYRLKDVYQFKAASTWKLYEHLNRWKNTAKWHIELDELRLLLGVAGKYPRWQNFKNRIIDSSIKEINESSDLRVNYEKTKQGRKISGLIFFIEIKQPDDEEIINIESNQDVLFKKLLSHGLNEKTVLKYVRLIEKEDKTEIILEKLPRMAENAKAKKAVLAQYITGAIKQELYQGNLYDALPDPPDHKEALDCWTGKRQQGEECKVRKRGTAGQRKKCKICLEKLPVADFGC